MEPFENIKLSFNCPKKLDELQPCGENWNCNNCQKMVYDFRGMTETQILDIFTRSGQKLCGIYDAERLTVLPQKPKWNKWLSAAIITLGLGAIGKMGYAQQANPIFIGKTTNTTIPKDTTLRIKIGKVAIVNPEVPGGNAAFEQYLHQHIKNKAGYKGSAIVSFMIGKDGSVDYIKMWRSAGQQLDDEIINALKHAPKFNPEKLHGQNYNISYTLPITFKE